MEALLILVHRWAHGDAQCFMDTSVCCSLLLLFRACSQNSGLINVFFPLSSAGLHCVQFLLDVLNTASVIWDLLSHRFCSKAL